jgi:hypothetical protein
MLHMKANYDQPSVDTLTWKLIPAEACHVCILQKDAIQNSEHLTLTYDGGGTQKHQSVYTIHVTSSEGNVYFLHGENGTGVSHNTKFVLETIDKVSLHKPRHLFSAAGCSGPQTLGYNTLQGLDLTVLPSQRMHDKTSPQNTRLSSTSATRVIT